MKPNFALNFTDDSITLLHRTKRGWTEVGSTAFDVEDLPAALADLRAKAEALAPSGITTKLVIPNSQIKYLHILAPGPDTATRKVQIAAGLEGQTPYDVTDLVWDYTADGETAQVAVLARETLDEAEGFAAANGFNPVSFVAIPLDSSFGTEPFFGQTSFSGSLLKAGTKVDRDADPVLPPPPAQPDAAPPRAADTPEPAAEPLPEPTPEPTSEPLPIPQPAPDTVPDPGPDVVPPPRPEPAPLPEETPQDLPLNDPPETPEPLNIPAPMEDIPPLAPVEMPPMPEMSRTGRDAAAGQAAYVAPSKDDLPFIARPEMPLSGAPVDPTAIAATLSAGDPPAATSVLDPAIRDLDEAPMAIDVADDPADAPGPRGRIVDPDIEDDLPPMPSGAALSAYAKRPITGTAAEPAPPVAPVLAEADRLTPRPGAKPATERPARPAPKFSYETPGEKPPSPATKALRGVTSLVTAPSIPGGRKAKVSPPATAATNAVASAAAAAAGTAAQGTAKGASGSARRPAGLGSRPMPVRGKPRHLGLILTGLLLIMLALAAGLSSFYVSWNRDDPADAIELSAAPDASAADSAEVDSTAIEDEMLADLQDPADLADPAAIDPAAEDATADLATAEPEPTDAPAADGVVMTAEDPVAAAPADPAPATVIAGDPAPANAPATEAQDEIFLSAADTPPAPVDPVALPAPALGTDTAPTAQQPPPPFGTVYQFDANGLIRPTPEGIATPEGVLLFAGSPALVPPSRPEAVTAAGQAVAQAAAQPTEATADSPSVAASGTEPEFLIPADPALADARPLPRPADLAPAAEAPAAEAATAADDGASLAPGLDSRIAALRPSARPETLAAQAVASGLIAPAVASANGSLALIAPEGTITPIGLSISRRPAARPQDMNRAVEAAVAAAIRLPDPEPPVAEPPVAEVTPETEEEPEIASNVAPRIPSTANVARQATVRNAINLRDMNLIGVYGTSSDRYALVRNPNGRYVKVAVGDRLDGGRVAAISASELRYEKRGRIVVLALPNS